MKRLILIVLSFSLVFSGIAIAETNWHTANQTTVGIVHDLAGIPADQIKYNVYLANSETDPNKENPSKIGVADTNEYLITLNTEGRFFVGVSAFRIIDGKEIASDIYWETDFGLQYFVVPLKPTKIILK